MRFFARMTLQKINTLAPYCALLAAYIRTCCAYDEHSNRIDSSRIYSLVSSSDNSTFEVVYPCANLTVEMIELYRSRIGHRFSWNAFTSTSKCREKAEVYGNTLFVIDIFIISSIGFQSFADIQLYSQFPVEEEVLLISGFNFRINSVNTQSDGKYIIILRPGMIDN
jgi:hypothetical protein